MTLSPPGANGTNKLQNSLAAQPTLFLPKPISSRASTFSISPVVSAIPPSASQALSAQAAASLPPTSAWV